MLDDRRPPSDTFGLPARLWVTAAARTRELRRRQGAPPTMDELRALARRVDAERERLTQLGGAAPSISELACAAGCDVELLVLAVSCRSADAGRLAPRTVLLDFARGDDLPAIAQRHGSTAAATARVLRHALHDER